MAILKRVQTVYGPGNPIPVGKTAFWENFVHDEDGEPKQFVPNTTVPRLRLVRIGLRAVAVFDDEVEALVEALRAYRDKDKVPTKRKAREPQAAREQPR
jgi:hypothetical protein